MNYKEITTNALAHDCKDCKFFVQHYRKSAYSFVKVYCGQCVNPNHRYIIKKKSPINDGCAEWEKAEDDEETIAFFVNKVNELNLKIVELKTFLNDYLNKRN